MQFLPQAGWHIIDFQLRYVVYSKYVYHSQTLLPNSMILHPVILGHGEHDSYFNLDKVHLDHQEKNGEHGSNMPEPGQLLQFSTKVFDGILIGELVQQKL